MENISQNVLSAALSYAERGWQVIPLHHVRKDGSCSCHKGAQCKSKGKHPRILEWEKYASKDTETIKEWFKRWPYANVGIVGGAESNLVILDVDPRHDGDNSLEALEKKFGVLPRTLMVATGGGGFHYYFRYANIDSGNKTGFHSGLDFKTTKGFVVAPPSMHVSGKNYQWIEADVELAEMPDWLIRELTRSSQPPNKAKPQDSSGEIVEGQRHTYLFKQACALRRTGMGETELLPALSKHNQIHCKPPLEEDEVESIVASVGKYPLESEPEIRLTDFGNAKWLVKEFGHDILYCPQWNQWLVWDGKRYKMDDCLEIERLAKRTTRKIRDAAELAADSRQRTEMLLHSVRSESLGRLRAMIELSQSEMGVTVHPDKLDQKPWLFNCANGILDLQTGRLMEHEREFLMTKASPVAYDANAKCTQWLSFLERIMDGKADLIRFLQQAAGYSLTASTREQCMYFLYGVGANGKSTYLNTLAKMLGDYAGTTPTSTLMAKKNEGIPNDIARLKGLRFVQAAEAELGKALAESLVKQMTGGDTLTGRFLHGEFFEFQPQFKLFLETNHKPVIRGTDDGIWRRIRLIPFEVTIPEAERDKNLMEKLERELPGILHWAVEGCLSWQRDGMHAPDAVNSATAEYRGEMDVLAAFIDQQCRLGNAERIGATELYRLYSDWCQTMNERPLRQNMFGMRIKERGFESRRGGGNGAYVWRGIGSIEFAGGSEFRANVQGL